MGSPTIMIAHSNMNVHHIKNTLLLNEEEKTCKKNGVIYLPDISSLFSLVPVNPAACIPMESRYTTSNVSNKRAIFQPDSV